MLWPCGCSFCSWIRFCFDTYVSSWCCGPLFYTWKHRNPMNRTHYHNCDSLKEGIMSPVISALDLSKHSAHPESWNSFKGVQTKSGKIFFFVYLFLFNKGKETKFLWKLSWKYSIEHGEWGREELNDETRAGSTLWPLYGLEAGCDRKVSSLLLFRPHR